MRGGIATCGGHSSHSGRGFVGPTLSRRTIRASSFWDERNFIIGTFWLVLGGCGSAVLAAAFPQLGIGFVGVALAFGLTVLTMAFAIGHISAAI